MEDSEVCRRVANMIIEKGVAKNTFQDGVLVPTYCLNERMYAVIWSGQLTIDEGWDCVFDLNIDHEIIFTFAWNTTEAKVLNIRRGPWEHMFFRFPKHRCKKVCYPPQLVCHWP